jgi:DNA-binding NarL/FixJ family response regulator
MTAIGANSNSSKLLGIMSNPVYRLLLVDPDPVFRLGLRAWLNPLADLEILAEADTAAQAVQILAGTAPALESSQSLSPRQTALKLDLVVLGFNIGQGSLNPASALELCQQLKSQYPALPILVMDFPQSGTEFSLSLKGRIEGYCLKGQYPEELVIAIRQVASGQTYWNVLPQNYNASDASSARLERPTSVWAAVKQNLYWSGIQWIDAALGDLEVERENFSLSTEDLLAKAILAGRMRELSAARWVVNRLWQPGQSRLGRSSPSFMTDDFPSGRSLIAPDNRDRPLTTPLVNLKTIQLSLFNTTVAKIQENLANLTPTVLEIDILREDQKRELFYIILRQIENSLSELRFAQTQLHQVSEKRAVILQDVWQLSLTEFFGKYYTVTDPKKGSIGVVDVLLQDGSVVTATILNKIPQVVELFSHLLFQTPLVINSHPYEVGTPEAMYRAEMLLDNLLIQIANAVMQPLLNHFADVEAVKQKFYTYNLIASRDIERFRNNLSWKYRLETYVAEPQAIFESRYVLWGFAESGMTQMPIYAPRTQELQQLQGIRLAVTLALELQDAIAPRLRSAVSFLGSGVVYVLTNVVGRGIGLIGRGVLQGIGSAWDENRFKAKGRSQ